MAKRTTPREYIKRISPQKVTYYYQHPTYGYDVLSREVYRNTRKEVHYPFFARSGAQKYRTIKKISYVGMPSPLPAGFLKSPGIGYGFTRELGPILYTLQDALPNLEHVVVHKTLSSKVLSPQEVRLSADDLEAARPKIAAQLAKHKKEKDTLSNNLLATILPSEFTDKRIDYAKGGIANYIDSLKLAASSLSKDDVARMADLLKRVGSAHPFFAKKAYLDTKQAFDRILIEDLIKQFKTLLGRSTLTKQLESKWQKFFADNLLYFSFGYIEKFEKQRIQGDTSLNIPDFILLDTFKYLDVFEIKTHLTPLLAHDKGRGNYYLSSEAAKALAQAENYIDSIVQNETKLIKNIRDEYEIEVDAVRPIVYIIASSKDQIAGPNTHKITGKRKRKLWNDFRRLNNSVSRIRFVLYDEVLATFENLAAKLTVKKPTKRKISKKAKPKRKRGST